MLRYFLTYSSIKLPLNLAEEIGEDALRNRNTYFRAEFDGAGRMLWVEKMVYGEVEMRHDYRYDAQGRLTDAVVSMPDEEPRCLTFTAA